MNPLCDARGYLMEMLIGEYGMTPHKAAFRFPFRAALALLVPRRSRTADPNGPSPASAAYARAKKEALRELNEQFKIIN